MYGLLLGSFALLSTLVWFIGYHVYDYFRDQKGLRRYPSMDYLAPFTNLSFMLLSRGGFRSRHLHRLHANGYPIVRIGPNSLSFSSPGAIKDIYGHGTPCVKDEQYVVTSGSHTHVADVVNKQDHARKRKMLASAYALKNLEDWEHKVADKVERMVTQFDILSKKQAVIDFRAWSNFFTLDAIADIGLSAKLGFLDTGNDECTTARPDGSTSKAHLRECLHAANEQVAHLSWSYRWYRSLVKPLCRLLSPHYRNLFRLNEAWDGIYTHLANERLKRYQAGEKLDDFFQALMEDKNGAPHNLEWGEILAETSIMMNAGSATTAIAIGNLLHQLLSHPDCLSKLRTEIDSVLDEDEIIAPYEKVRHLDYLRACLNESMRLNPPVSHNLPRMTPAQGAQILDEWIPGNTTVSISAYVAHRDPELFPDPEVFTPDRWMGDGGKDLGPYFIAFTAGARSCIGRNISYLEQTVLIASLLHRYDFELAVPGFQPTRYETMGLTMGEIPIRATLRNDLSS